MGYAEGLTDCDHKNHQWSHPAPPSVCRCTALALRGKAGILHNSHSQKCLQADPWNYTVFQKHCNDRNSYQLWTLERDGGFRVPHDGGFLCLTRYDPTEGAYSSAVHLDWDSEHWNAVEIGTQD